MEDVRAKLLASLSRIETSVSAEDDFIDQTGVKILDLSEIQLIIKLLEDSEKEDEENSDQDNSDEGCGDEERLSNDDIMRNDEVPTPILSESDATGGNEPAFGQKSEAKNAIKEGGG